MLSLCLLVFHWWGVVVDIRDEVGQGSRLNSFESLNMIMLLLMVKSYMWMRWLNKLKNICCSLGAFIGGNTYFMHHVGAQFMFAKKCRSTTS